MAESLTWGLQAEGYVVDVADNGEDGLWKARETAHDVIILDVMLPGLDGYQVCTQLREQGLWTPILMLTAMDEDLDHAVGAADDGRRLACGRAVSGRPNPGRGPGLYACAVNERSSQELPVWETFLRAHAAVIPLLEGDLARAGLIPLNRYDVLANLQTAGGSLRMRGLVSGVVLSQPSVSRLVNEMERDGQVRRDRDPGDRRGVVVSMTDRGAQDLARARSIHQRGIQEHFYRHVAAADEEPMRRALSRVLRAAASRSTAQA